MSENPTPREIPLSNSSPSAPGTGDAAPLQHENPNGRRARLRSLLSSESVRGALKLTGGSGLAQLIAIAAAPILTRLYTPSDFGALAIYMSVSAILVVIATGHYEMAIILPKDDEDAVAVAGIALLLSTVTAVLTLVGAALLFFLYSPISDSAFGAWIFILPATVFMGGCGATFVAYAVRHGEFGTVAAMGVVRQIVGSATSIGLGLLKVGAGGLIVGGFLSVSAANVRLGRPVIRDLRTHRPTRMKIVDNARRYSKFPRHTLPAEFLRIVAVSGLPILIGSFFGAATLGIWSLTHRVLMIPAALVGQAASETYYRRAVQLRDSPKRAVRLFDKTVVSLAGISIIPFALIGIFGEWAFGIIFGPEWSEAGVYARIMLPWIWIRLVSRPVSRTPSVYERNSVSLKNQMWLFATLLLVTAGAVVFNLSFTSYLLVLSLASAASYIVFMAFWRRLILKAPRTASA